MYCAPCPFIFLVSAELHVEFGIFSDLSAMVIFSLAFTPHDEVKFAVNFMLVIGSIPPPR